MTALRKYQRLECGGLWRETPQDQRREVLVSFGEATLILSDPKTGTAVSHWSLPAIERINRGEEPPVFAPGGDALESLELTDPEMIAALGAVRHAVQAASSKPGRLRGGLLAASAAAVVLVAAIWLPGALVSHTASVVPLAQRADIGQRALDDLPASPARPATTSSVSRRSPRCPSASSARSIRRSSTSCPRGSSSRFTCPAMSSSCPAA
jgi:hypothetical protein